MLCESDFTDFHICDQIIHELNEAILRSGNVNDPRVLHAIKIAILFMPFPSIQKMLLETFVALGWSPFEGRFYLDVEPIVIAHHVNFIYARLPA